MTIEIVSFPIKNGGSFHSYVNVYQRVDVLLYMWLVFPMVSCEIPLKNQSIESRQEISFTSPTKAGSR